MEDIEKQKAEALENRKQQKRRRNDSQAMKAVSEKEMEENRWKGRKIGNRRRLQKRDSRIAGSR